MTVIPYALIPLVLVVWLSARHWRSGSASERSKRAVVVATVVSVGLLFWPGSGIGVTVFQTAICIYVAMHETLTRPDPANFSELAHVSHSDRSRV